MMPMVIMFVLLGIAVVAGVALLASGRWQDPGLPADRNDRGVPDFVDVPLGALTADDLQELQIDPAVRGYRMDEVDAVIDRLVAEISDRDEVIRQLQGHPLESAAQSDEGTPDVSSQAPLLGREDS
jgi:DivIVA domain-containing protein